MLLRSIKRDRLKVRYRKLKQRQRTPNRKLSNPAKAVSCKTQKITRRRQREHRKKQKVSEKKLAKLEKRRSQLPGKTSRKIMRQLRRLAVRLKTGLLIYAGCRSSLKIPRFTKDLRARIFWKLKKLSGLLRIASLDLSLTQKIGACPQAVRELPGQSSFNQKQAAT